MDPTFLSLGGGTKTLLKSVAEVKRGTALPRLAPRKGREAYTFLCKHRRPADGAAKYQDQNEGTSIKRGTVLGGTNSVVPTERKGKFGTKCKRQLTG